MVDVPTKTEFDILQTEVTNLSMKITAIENTTILPQNIKDAIFNILTNLTTVLEYVKG